MRSIGIPVANRPECIDTLEQAFALSQILGADVIGYHMRPDRRASSDISLGHLWLGENPDKIWLTKSLSEEKAAAIGAGELFNKMATAHDYAIAKKRGKPGKEVALFLEKTGSPNKLMPLIGPVNDLLMVSRPQTAKSVKAMSIMMSAILESRAPVLVLPKKAAPLSCKRIVVAWNRGKTETILVHNALNLLKQADEVILLSVGSDHHHGPAAKDMVDYLKSHGIKARSKRVLAKNDGQGLVQAFKQEKAGLLLCGAYTRGHLRELVFGGMTKFLLEKSDFPILFQHI